MYKYLRVTISHDNQQAVTNKLFERDKKIESLKSKIRVPFASRSRVRSRSRLRNQKSDRIDFGTLCWPKKKTGNAPVFWLKATSTS